MDTQRSRWEGGRLRMLAINGPILLRDVLQGRMRALEPLLDLLLLPLALHVCLLLIALSSPSAAVRSFGVAGIAIVGAHILAAVATSGAPWRTLTVLPVAPLYIIWKLFMLPSLLRTSTARSLWIRTERQDEREVLK